MDGLLDLMEADERYRFTLDGQLATLDDYLEVRPEAAERVRRLVDEGRLAIGPWQVLMDEFLVSGETIVRNLEYGQRRGAEFGGAMTVGYLPDMFGHVAQMPQILRQAGIDVAVVWRGVPAAIDSHSFEWESPDGSSVRAEYLPYGYSNGAYLLDVPGQLGRGLEAVRESHREFFGDEPILAMFGTDHMEPVPRLTDLLEESGAAAQVSTLADYLAAVDGRPHQQRWRGELRSSARANMLMGTLSARLDLKAAMARAERALTRYAEPFQALYGTAWPDRLLDLAWRRVIENSAHDSICGCSVDEVSTQVLVRCYEAEQIAMGLAEDTAREAAAAAPMGSVVAFNPSPTARWDNVELSLAVPARWKDIALELPDGTRVAAQRITRNEPLLYEERVPSSGVSEWLRRRLHGRELFARRLNRMIIEGRTVTFEVDEEDDPIWLDLDELKNELEVATSGEDGEWDVRIVASRRSDVVARVPAPALGWTALQPVEGTGSVEDAVQVSPDRLDNGLLSIRRRRRRDTLARRRRGCRPPRRRRRPRRQLQLRAACRRPRRRGPRRGSSLGRCRGPGARSAEHRPVVPLVARAGAGGRRDDRRATSRRAVLPCPRLLREPDRRPSPSVSRPAPAGGSVLRRRGPVRRRRAWRSRPRRDSARSPCRRSPPTASSTPAAWRRCSSTRWSTSWCDGGRELALTILRSTGLISRSAHAYRESPAGPEIAIPDAQCRGPWSIGFALYPHDGVWHQAGVLAQLERYLHPFLVAPGAALDGPTQGSGPELRGEGVVLSSLRLRGRRLEARVACEHPEPVQAQLGGSAIDLRPWEIRTVELAR